MDCIAVPELTSPGLLDSPRNGGLYNESYSILSFEKRCYFNIEGLCIVSPLTKPLSLQNTLCVYLFGCMYVEKIGKGGRFSLLTHASVIIGVLKVNQVDPVLKC